MTGPLYWCNCTQRCSGGKNVSERTYRRHAVYREAQLSPEFSQFLEKNRNHNGTTNSESQISTGYKRPADESAGYVEGGMQAVTKEQRVDRNYEGVERASSELSEAADLVRRNTVIRIHIKLI